MNDYTLEEKIEISNRINFAANILISAAVTLVIGTMLFKLLWSWTIPEIFPAAVEQGLILGDITWLAALKIAALVAILTSTGSLLAGRWGLK
ncbi:MAG: hypothetical protein PVG14_20030 [Anaerolineales bacterium]